MAGDRDGDAECNGNTLREADWTDDDLRYVGQRKTSSSVCMWADTHSPDAGQSREQQHVLCNANESENSENGESGTRATFPDVSTFTRAFSLLHLALGGGYLLHRSPGSSFPSSILLCFLLHSGRKHLTEP